ncbi:MAG: hypothetical protein M3247_06670 [Thermoproteota archaeon]|nr:hypothetical protein [Thermoproteota archaeon]
MGEGSFGVIIRQSKESATSDDSCKNKLKTERGGKEKIAKESKRKGGGG